jgi:hypothetical protein
MADISVSDFTSLINEQVNLRENLSTCLSKLQALIVVALDNEFAALPEVTINEYLWAVNDFVSQAIALNSEGLDVLYNYFKLEAGWEKFNQPPQI